MMTEHCKSEPKSLPPLPASTLVTESEEVPMARDSQKSTLIRPKMGFSKARRLPMMARTSPRWLYCIPKTLSVMGPRTKARDLFFFFMHRCASQWAVTGLNIWVPSSCTRILAERNRHALIFSLYGKLAEGRKELVYSYQRKIPFQHMYQTAVTPFAIWTKPDNWFQYMNKQQICGRKEALGKWSLGKMLTGSVVIEELAWYLYTWKSRFIISRKL